MTLEPFGKQPPPTSFLGTGLNPVWWHSNLILNRPKEDFQSNFNPYPGKFTFSCNSLIHGPGPLLFFLIF